MSSRKIEIANAADRFRQAFERLKANRPKNVPKDTPVTQNNVAREAGRDPSALKKVRFPALVREIQAYIELHENRPKGANHQQASRKNVRRSAKQQLDDARRQRDAAQSAMASANRRIVELIQQVQILQSRLDEFRPPPISL